MRLIDADALKRYIPTRMDMQDMYLPVHFKTLIDEQPTVDAVKHGEWMETDALPHRIYCSKCYATYIPNKEWVAWKENMIPRNYCPNCGAKMKGETEHGNTYSLGKIEMPKGVMEQIIAAERKDDEQIH